ncbi:MAG: hypothetical protein RIR79_1058 [Pseudomonadota bacterium]|jgi:formamidopyrimidine-DNA glycosylase
MPELPEVEVTRLSFVHRISGSYIEEVRLGKPLRWSLGIEPSELTGRMVLGVRRRGKYLLLDMDTGLLLIHLGMSGRLSFSCNPPEAGKHDHFEMRTSAGVLRLHDPRRFGAVVWAAEEKAESAQKLLGKLGMEPLSDEFTPQKWYLALQRRTAPIKSVLLAGDTVVGVGNIYASEALFGARIRPTIRACDLSLARVVRLHGAVQQVLARALEVGGSTLRDFSNAHGEDGHFQLEARVYAREGLPCTVCSTPIRMLRQGQRSTFFCYKCQKY